MRKAIFWTHLAAGVIAGLLIVFFSVTGALIAYERPILRAADSRDSNITDSPAAGSPMPLADLVAKAAEAANANVESITVRAGSHSMVEVQTVDHRTYLLNPYTGATRGVASPKLRAFFAEVTALHRWFGLADAHHATAIAVKGIATLALLLLIVSGLYLWMPRKWTRKSVKSAIVPHLDARGRAWKYHWHRVTGFWIALPFGVIALTGVIMAFPWANAALFHLAGSPVPQRQAFRRNEHGKDRGGPQDPSQIDKAFASAEASIDGWQTVSLRWPPTGREFNFTVDRSEGGHPDTRIQVAIDSKRLEVTHKEDFASLSRGQQWRAWTRFVHTGEAGGWWGETIAFLTALAAILLATTGLLLSLGRVQRWRAKSEA